MKTTIITILLSVTLVGCASPAGVIALATLPGEVHRTQLETASAPAPTGQSVSITRSRYQFVPNASAMDKFCRAELLAQHPNVDPATINMKHGRNILTGVSSCTATAQVK